jgi:hypothetical protein
LTQRPPGCRLAPSLYASGRKLDGEHFAADVVKVA